MTIQDADYDDPQQPAEAAKARPGKATHAAPVIDGTARTVASSAVVATAADKFEIEQVLTDKPLEILLSEDKRKDLLAKLRGLVQANEPNLATEAGRDRLKSFCYKLVRTRTTVVDAAKTEAQEIRKRATAIAKLGEDLGASIKVIEDEARRPLVEWEAEQARLERDRDHVRNVVADVNRWMNREAPPLTTDELTRLEGMLDELELVPGTWGDLLEEMQATIGAAKRSVRDKRELAELREENARLSANKARANEPVPEFDDVQDEAPIVRDEAPTGEPQQLRAPQVNRTAPPAAGAAAPELTPTQKARRLILPVLLEYGMDDNAAKRLILAIENGALPGVVATYIEKEAF